MSRLSNYEPELFDADDDGEPMREYAIEPEDEAIVDRLCAALTDVLTHDPEFLQWLDERDAECIAMMNAEVN